MPRFVILHHEMPPGSARASHFDLMIEVDEVLRTWALAEELAVAKTISAEALADHRLAYLTYEGPVSGDRGSVTQWDAGDYTTIEDLPTRLVLQLNGQRCSGEITLTQSPADDQRWSVSVRKS